MFPFGQYPGARRDHTRGRGTGLRSGLLCCWVLWGWLSGCGLPNTATAQVQPTPVTVERPAVTLLEEVFVPLKSLTPSSLRDRTLLPWAQYLQVRENWGRAAQEPSGVRLEQAVFEADIVGDKLQNGRFQWRIRSPHQRPQFWNPAGLRFAVSSLKWGTREAVWGWSQQSGTVILLDGTAGESLVGNWSATGRQFLQRVEFSLQFPEAVVATLRLRVPRDLSLDSDLHTAHIVGADGDFRIWEIVVGNSSRCEFDCFREAGGPALPAATVVRDETVYALGQEGVRLRSDFRLEIPSAPLKQLTFEIDPDLELVSVSLGNDSPLAWQVQSQQNLTRVIVPLPDPLTGKDRIVRLRAVAPLRAETEWKLPVIRLPDSIYEGGTTALIVTSPLQITRLNADGYRQTGVELTPQREDLWTFKQFRSTGILQVMLGTPRPRLAARVLSDVQLETRDWLSLTQLQLTAAEGAAYSVTCRVPSGWEVIDVQGVGDVPLDWNLTTQSNGDRHLGLQFLEAVGPGTPVAVEIQARRTPLPSNQPTAIPAFEPLGADELQMLIAMSSGNEVRPTLELATSFEPLPAAELSPDWTLTEFWQTRLAKRTPTPQLWQLTGTLPEGHFSLQSLQTPIAVSVQATAKLSPELIAETVRLQVTPQHGRVERILAYFSESGPQWSWKAGTADAPWMIEARRLPLSRHAAWDLPPTGELWSLQLSQPISTPVELIGERSRAGLSQGRLGMLFIPQTAQFQGEYSLETADGLVVDYHPQDMEQIARPASSGGAWSWQTARSTLEFKVRELPTSLIAPVIRDVTVRHRWSAVPDQPDEYQIVCHLGAGFSGRELVCYLPPDALGIEVRIDDDSIPAVRSSRLEPIRLTTLQDQQTLEFRYRMDSARSLGPHWKLSQHPRFSVPVLRTDFEFLVPPGWELGAEPDSLRFRNETGTVPWMRRLFGPLGQLREFPDFWKGLAEAPTPTTTELAASTTGTEDDLWNSRQRWRASTTGLPEELSLWIWPTRYVTLGSWLAVWGLGIWGVLSRVGRWPGRKLYGAMMLGLFVCLALALPMAPATIVGGGVSGLLLSILIPRRLLTPWELAAQSPPVAIPSGSTRSFPVLKTAPVWVAILLGGGCLAPVFAQPSAPVSATIQIWIPQQSNPQLPPEFVYVPTSWWESVRPKLVAQTQVPGSLVQSVNYRVVIEADQSLGLLARYRLLLKAQAEPHLVEIPGGPWKLDAAQPCLVNGQPQPILTRAGSTSWWISVTAPPLPAEPTTATVNTPESSQQTSKTAGESTVAESGSTDRPAPPALPTEDEKDPVNDPLPEPTAIRAEATPVEQLPITEPRPENPVPSPSSGLDYRPVNVEFRGFLIPQGTTEALKVSWSLPLIPDAKLHLENHHPERTWEFRADEAPGQSVRPQETGVFDVGLLTGIQLQEVFGTRRTTARMDVTQQALADVQPGSIVLRQRVLYRVSEGHVGVIRWELPPGLTLRTASNPDLKLLTRIPRADGSQQVVLEFEQPQTGNFAVTAELILGNTGPDWQVRIPSVQLLDVDGTTPLRPSLHTLGIRTTPEFQIDPPADVGEQIKLLPVDQFIAQWGPTTVRPLLALQLLDPVAVNLSIRQLQPQRVVRRLELTGLLESRRLFWQATATVEVQNSAAFGHVVEVDPRWIITQISVKEDNADRLLRWTRLGNQIQIYLRDRTIGTQTIQITGTVPLQVPQEVALPTLSFLNSTVGEARLQLFQDPDVAVELLEPARWQTVADSAETRPPQARSLLLGRYQWPLDAPPLVVRTGQNEPLIDCDQLTVLQPRDGRWRWTSYMVFHVRRGHGSQFLIRLPSELSQTRVTAANVRELQNPEAEEGRLVSLMPQQAVAGDFLVQVMGEVVAPQEGAWTLPEVVAVNATPREHYLLLGGRQLQVNPPAVSGLAPGQLPQELARWLPADLDLATLRVFQGVAPRWNISLPSPIVRRLPAEVVWGETQLWPTNAGLIQGRTQWYIGPQDALQFEVELPAETNALAALVDGAFTVMTNPEPNRLRIPIGFPQGGHVVTLHWSRAVQRLTGNSTGNWLNVTVPLPQAAGIADPQHAVSWTPPPGLRTVWYEGGSRLTQRQLTAWQILAVNLHLDQRFAQGQPPLDPVSARLSHETTTSWERLQAERGRSPLLSTDDAQLAEMMPRLAASWQALLDTGEVDDSLFPAGTSTDKLLTVGQFGRRGGGLWFNQSGQPREVQIVLIPDLWWNWGWSIVGGVALVLILLRLGRSRLTDWLAEHPAVGWLVLGVVWWLCLHPTWVALICWGIGLLAGSRVLRRSVYVPSAPITVDAKTATSA